MKISKLLLLIGLLLVALNCNAQKPRYIKTDSFEGVAFPLIPRLSTEDVKNEFMPSVNDIMKLEKKLSDSLSFIISAYMKRYSGGRYELQCDIIKNLKKYKRQYTGFIINGKKMIITRFYLNPQGNWREEILGPSENSGCVEFLIYYEVGSGKLFNFFTDLSPM